MPFSRPSLRSTSSGRPPVAAAQTTLRNYFSPLSHNTSPNSLAPTPKVDDANSLAARKAIRNHHDLAKLSTAETTDPSKPPIKPSATQPPTARLHTTNGDLSSAASTPRPDSLSNSNAPQNKTSLSSKETRTLRSKDGGSRLKSALTIYFANYDDIITDAPKPPGMCSTSTFYVDN
jgi:hypothetical protein